MSPRNFLFPLAVGCSVVETVAVGLGGRIFEWEFLVWVWTVPVWACAWWMASGRADS